MEVETINEDTGVVVDEKQEHQQSDEVEEESLPKNRFSLELEFLQMLASPAYLHFLAINEYLNDPKFLEFLDYLKYWKRPEYVKYITYPHSLYFLDQLSSNEKFRRELKQMPFRDFVHQQQFESWRYRNAQLYGVGSKVMKAKEDDEGGVDDKS